MRCLCLSFQLAFVVLDDTLRLVLVELLELPPRVLVPNLEEHVPEALALALGLIVEVELYRVEAFELFVVDALLPSKIQNSERIDKAIDVHYLGGGLLLGHESEGHGAVLPALVPVKLSGGDNLQGLGIFGVRLEGRWRSRMPLLTLVATLER